MKSTDLVPEIKYKFINELVDTFYESSEKLIDNAVQMEDDKSVFLMFILMYFASHLKVKTVLNNKTPLERKEIIKKLLEDVISDPSKRALCIRAFDKKFRFLSDDHKQLQLE